MAKIDKLIAKFLQKPALTNLKFDELIKLMKYFEYDLIEGKGSAVSFYNEKSQDIFSLHKPHPSSQLKAYVVRKVQSKLDELMS